MVGRAMALWLPLCEKWLPRIERFGCHQSDESDFRLMCEGRSAGTIPLNYWRRGCVGGSRVSGVRCRPDALTDRVRAVAP